MQIMNLPLLNAFLIGEKYKRILSLVENPFILLFGVKLLISYTVLITFDSDDNFEPVYKVHRVSSCIKKFFVEWVIVFSKASSVFCDLFVRLNISIINDRPTKKVICRKSILVLHFQKMVWAWPAAFESYQKFSKTEKITKFFFWRKLMMLSE